MKFHRYRVAFLIAAGMSILMLTLPMALRFALESWLNKQPGIVAQIKDIDLNLFNATLQMEGIVIHQESHPAFTAKNLHLQFDWLPLLHRRIVLDHIRLEDGQLQLSFDGASALAIAGFTLNLAPTGADTGLPTEQQLQNNTHWGIASGAITINNFLLRYHQPELDLNLTINHLAATPMVSWLAQQPATLGCDLAINGAPLQISAQLLPFAAQPSITGDFSMSAFDITSIAPLLSTLGWNNAGGQLSSQLHLNLSADTALSELQMSITGEVSGNGINGANAEIWVRNLNFKWRGDTTIEHFFATPTAALAGKLTLTDSDVEFQQPGYRWQQHQLSWEGQTSLGSTTHSDRGTFDIYGDVQLEQSTLADLEQQRQLISIDQATVSGLHCRRSEPLRCDTIRLHTVQALQRQVSSRTDADSAGSTPALAPHIVTLATAELSTLAYTEQQLHAGQLHLSGLNLNLLRTASGALEIQQWLLPRPNSATTPVPAATLSSENRQPATPLFGTIAQVLVDEGSSVNFTDESLATPAHFQATDIQLSVDALNRNKTEQSSPITLSATLDKHASLNLSGQIQPFTSTVDFTLSGTIKEFHLPGISPYTESSIGYALNQGQLSLDFTAPCSQGQLSIDSTIFLSQLRMQPLNAADKDTVTASLGMPVNLALALLRDRDGNINLQLPVRGNLNDPSLKIAPALRLALTNSIKNTVMLTLAPLGVVAKAGQLVGIGSTLSFERLTFEPGTAQLSTTSQHYLAQIAELLTSHPQLVSTISSRITPSDIEQLQQRMSSLSRGTPTPPVPPASVVIPANQLLHLAGQRADLIKEALLERQVANAQLLMTKPQSIISSGDPGVDLTIQ